MIACGDLRPGAPLSRRDLSKRLGIGSVPISEAVKRLERDGLIESRPRAGSRVKIPTLQEVRDMLVIREAFEIQSARLFAVAAGEEQRRALSDLAGRLDRLLLGLDSHREEYLATHAAFHSHIARNSECAALVEAIERTRVLQQTWLSAPAFDLRCMMVTEHSGLARTLCSGDPDESERAMRVHVRHCIDELLKEMENRFEEGDNASTPIRRVLSRATWKVRQFKAGQP
jgi:GntR family transcriptional regulator, rspAB operon transcriptional repressor